MADTNKQFDAGRSFDSVQEAVDYANEQEKPIEAFWQIVVANSEMDEWGFAGDLVHDLSGGLSRGKPVPQSQSVGAAPLNPIR